MDDIRIQYLQEANPNHASKLEELSEKQKEVASSLSCLQNDEYFMRLENEGFLYLEIFISRTFPGLKEARS